MWDFLIALDKRLAGLMGFSGERTVSAECAVSTCFFCRAMRRGYRKHCERSKAYYDALQQSRAGRAKR